MSKETANRTRRTGAIFLIAFVLTQLAIFAVFPLLNPAVSYPNVVSLEFARFVGEERAEKILEQWRCDERIEIAQWNVRFDFLFIACYTTVMFLACRWSASELAADGYHKAGRAGRLLAPAQVAAGAFDVLENVFLLLMLRHGARGSSYAGLACTFATIKAVLLTAGMIYVTVAAARALARATARPKPPGSGAAPDWGHSSASHDA